MSRSVRRHAAVHRPAVLRRNAARLAGAAVTCAALAACSSGTDPVPGAGAGSTAAAPGPATPTVAASAAVSAGTATGPSAGASASSARPTPARPAATASRPAAGPAGTRPAATRPGTRWRPRAGLTWQWQLSGTIDTSVRAQVFDVDLFETPASTVKALQAKGSKVICYVNVGAWEEYRPDAGQFPAAVLGKGNGWPGEKWVDIRRTDVLAPIMARRFDLCATKGFDAVEPDLVEAYTNDSGFPVTAAHQLAYNRLIARLAHERGLAVGLKNDLEQVGALVGTFDFAVNEQCAEFDECAALVPFIRAGKPVFHVEYAGTPAQFCPTVKKLGFSSLAKREDLGAWRVTC